VNSTPERSFEEPVRRAEGSRAALSLALLALTVVGAVAVTIVGWADQGPAPLVVIVYAFVGALIVRRADNAIGWLFQAMALLVLTSTIGEAYVFKSSLATGPFPGVGYFGLVQSLVLAPFIALIEATFLLFPTGRSLSPAWRPVLWAAAALAAAAVIGQILIPGPMDVNYAPKLANPLGVESLSSLGHLLTRVSSLGLVACAAAAVAALVVRFRRSSAVERHQIRWLMFVAVLAFALFLIAALGSSPGGIVTVGVGNTAWAGFILALALGIPAAMAIAILRYRLYDIDVVIRRTVVFALLALFITAVYAIVVAGIGAVVGRQSSLLAFAAAVVVAIAFQPARDRARRLADRVVYGHRATPYEVLTELSTQLSLATSTDEALPRIARIVGEGTGAKRARVWLRAGGSLVPSASWPADGTAPPSTVAISGGELPALPATESFPVSHAGALLGAIALEEDPADPLTPTKAGVVRDVAGQAGLVLRNVALVEDLRASRLRIVSAQAEERRRIQRSLQEGAERDLMEIERALDEAEGIARREAPSVAGSVHDLRTGTGAALENLRGLAGGVYPPLLEARGIVSALRAQTASSPVHVEVTGDRGRRFPIDVEAAVYFSALEAAQNALKYADASTIRVRVDASANSLAFEVEDDGNGFDTARTGYGTGLQGMEDRLAALGGRLEVRSEPSRGTVVGGIVPSADRSPTAMDRMAP